MYRLNLLIKMKIYLIQYIIMLELAYRDLALLVYKENTYRGQEENTYRGQEENKQPLKRIISYEEVDNKIWYKVLQEGYKETIQELEENLENAKDKIKVY